MILERERIEGLETMERALGHYGANAQMLKCIEEMGELSRALARALNPNEQTDWVNICEEIADVSILLDQLYIHLGNAICILRTIPALNTTAICICRDTGIAPSYWRNGLSG